MKIGWTYSGNSVSLLEFVRETDSQKADSINVYRTRPQRDPEANCNIKTKDIQKVPRLSWIDQAWLQYRWGKFIEPHVEENDILITENILGPPTVSAAKRHGIPCIFFIRSLLVLGHDKYDQQRGHIHNYFTTDIGGRVQYPFLTKCVNSYEKGMQSADVIVANSKFTANYINENFNINPEIIYPPIKLDNYKCAYNPNGKITMVNPRAKYKGSDIFLDIAAVMESEDFLVVGFTNDEDTKRRMSKLDNVEHIGWIEDMKEVYSRSKAVIVPSRCEEAFGRVPAEAMASGIPCVVSNRGGLPEVVGETGKVVENIESIGDWITALQNILAEDDRSKRESRRKRVEKYSMENQFRLLWDIISRNA